MNKRDKELMVLDQLKESELIWNTIPFSKINKYLNDRTEEELSDMVGFISFCENKNKDQEYITNNLLHDLQGLDGDDLFFAPRTEGFAEHLKFKAYLIEVSLMTRIESPFDLTKEDIVKRVEEKLRNKLVDKLHIELHENIISVKEDKEMPYQPGE